MDPDQLPLALPEPLVKPKQAIPQVTDEPVPLGDVLADMQSKYQQDPVNAVRGQHFIKTLHDHIAAELQAALLPQARKVGITVMKEVTLFGSHKPKDADVALVHPHNGPLMIIGVRSQMSSIGNNVLEYYQGIVGECISLQDRFPMATIGYVYLHPLRSRKWRGRGEAKVLSEEVPDHARYAKMYNAITGRDGTAYKDIRGVYDQFAYMVVDFEAVPPVIRDDVVQAAVPLSKADLRIENFTDRMIETFKERNIWLDIFR